MKPTHTLFNTMVLCAMSLSCEWSSSPGVSRLMGQALLLVHAKGVFSTSFPTTSRIRGQKRRDFGPETWIAVVISDYVPEVPPFTVLDDYSGAR